MTKLKTFLITLSVLMLAAVTFVSWIAFSFIAADWVGHITSPFWEPFTFVTMLCAVPAIAVSWSFACSEDDG